MNAAPPEAACAAGVTERPGFVAIGAYAAGSFGTGVFSTVPALLLLYFCTQFLHLPPAWASVIVFVPKVWAIAWDPLVGVWSDRAVTRIGRRRPFLIVGTCGVAVLFVAVFSPPDLPAAATAAWMGVMYFLLATVYSLFAVPYVAVASELPVEAAVRARLVAWRMLIAMMGVLAGAGLVPHLVELAGGGRGGYARMSLVIASACAITMSMPIWMLSGRDQPNEHQRGRGVPMLRQLGVVLRERAFLQLAASYVLQLTAVGIVSATAPYVVTGAFHRPDGDIGTAMIGMLGATTLSMPLWASVGRRFGNGLVLTVAVVLFGAGAAFLGILALAEAPWWEGRLAFVLIGIPFAGMQVLPYTLIAHLVHACAKAGAAGESSYTGLWTASEKLGLAFGPALTGVVLALSRGRGTRAVAELVAAGPALLSLMSLPLVALATRRPGPTSGLRASREAP